MGNNSSLQKKSPREAAEEAVSFLMLLLSAFNILILFGKIGLNTYTKATILVEIALCGLILIGAVILLILSRTPSDHAAPGLKEIFHTICTPDRLLLVFLPIWFVVSCLYMAISEQDTGYFNRNAESLIDCVISVMVIYPLAAVFRRKPKYIEWMLHLVMILATLFMAYVLIRLLRSGSFMLPGGEVYMTSSKSLKIACNRNTTGAFGSILFMISLFMIFTHRKWRVRIPYIAAALIHLTIMNLSNSRTACYAVMIVCALMGIALCYKNLRTARWKRLLISLLCGAAVGVLLYACRKLTYSVCGLFPGFSASSVTAGAVRDDLTSLGGREKIFASFLPALFSSFGHFLFGVTPDGVALLITKAGYMHNQYMQMGVAFGFPGLLAYTVWSLIILKKCLCHLNTVRGIMVTGVIVMLIISNMFESYLFGCFFFSASLFYLFCGMMADDETGVKSFRELLS